MVKTNVQTQFGQNKRRKTDYYAKPHWKSLKGHKTTGNTLLKREHIIHGTLINKGPNECCLPPKPDRADAPSPTARDILIRANT